MRKTIHTPRPTLYRLTHSSVSDRGELWHCRDGIAWNELAAVLQEEYRYGTTIHLYPGDSNRDLLEYASFALGDCLLMSTRPPLGEETTSKRIRWSGGPLDLAIASALKENYFVSMDRVHLKLKPQCESFLTKGTKWSEWGNEVHFHENRPTIAPGKYKGSNAGISKSSNRESDAAHYRKFYDIAKAVHGRIHWLRRSDGSRRLQKVEPWDSSEGARLVSGLGVMARVRNLRFGERMKLEFIGCWGWCGLTTLAFSRWLRRSHPEWLRASGPSLLVVEMRFLKPLPTLPLLSPAWVDSPGTVEFNPLLIMP